MTSGLQPRLTFGTEENTLRAEVRTDEDNHGGTQEDTPPAPCHNSEGECGSTGPSGIARKRKAEESGEWDPRV